MFQKTATTIQRLKHLKQITINAAGTSINEFFYYLAVKYIPVSDCYRFINANSLMVFYSNDFREKHL
jgi:hypothetical protein